MLDGPWPVADSNRSRATDVTCIFTALGGSAGRSSSLKNLGGPLSTLNLRVLDLLEYFTSKVSEIQLQLYDGGPGSSQHEAPLELSEIL